MDEVYLNIDGKDEIKIHVKDGIEFVGTVRLVEIFGDEFVIKGKLEEII